MLDMKETRFKPLLFAAVAAALTLSPATKAAENADYIRFSGRLLTHSEASAMLARARNLPRLAGADR